MTERMIRHFELGDFVVETGRPEGYIPTSQDALQVLEYTPQGACLVVNAGGFRGFHKSRKEAQDATGHPPRRCLMAGIVVWQEVQEIHPADLQAVEDAGVHPPIPNPMIQLAPANAREKVV
jgi:hypothetical protein